ncbi:hypothetical protein QBC37DRAFT_477297 [Rhypophila decipiens]|uniref:Uncharacterized protein n=1 Tax=Rhypophila decipiens TaxID=261697 RepID=A0AAN7BED0_9PEZI|nr:hypothetical protein QBC37DRAFT_477297 [Rhypophila decipiens]
MEYHDPLERELENCSAGDSCNGSIVANLQEPTQPITMDQRELAYGCEASACLLRLYVCKKHVVCTALQMTWSALSFKPTVHFHVAIHHISRHPVLYGAMVREALMTEIDSIRLTRVSGKVHPWGSRWHRHFHIPQGSCRSVGKLRLGGNLGFSGLALETVLVTASYDPFSRPVGGKVDQVAFGRQKSPRSTGHLMRGGIVPEQESAVMPRFKPCCLPAARQWSGPGVEDVEVAALRKASHRFGLVPSSFEFDSRRA